MPDELRLVSNQVGCLRSGKRRHFPHIIKLLIFRVIDSSFNGMRVLFAISILLVTFAAQASGLTPPPASTQFAGTHAQLTTDRTSSSTLHATNEELHGSSESHKHHKCASVGHCAASAIGVSSFLFKTNYYSSQSLAALYRAEVGSGFTSPPYRPPAAAP